MATTRPATPPPPDRRLLVVAVVDDLVELVAVDGAGVDRVLRGVVVAGSVVLSVVGTGRLDVEGAGTVELLGVVRPTGDVAAVEVVAAVDVAAAVEWGAAEVVVSGSRVRDAVD